MISSLDKHLYKNAEEVMYRAREHNFALTSQEIVAHRVNYLEKVVIFRTPMFV